MSKELCNDGRCKRVRLGEDRHPSHIEKDERYATFYFEKIIAIYQVLATAGVAIGAIVMTMGFSMVKFAESITIIMVNQTGTLHQNLETLRVNNSDTGYQLLWFGLSIIIVVCVISVGLIYTKKNEKIVTK